MTEAILELSDARLILQSGARVSISLTLRAGDFALIDARAAERIGLIGDLAGGVVACAPGTARFIGRDWARLPPAHAAALRGRIGRVFADGGWIDFADMAINLLLPMRHHTRVPEDELRERAARLCLRFGLPGLPLVRPGQLSPLELARAGCARALLGDPVLLVLETPLQGRYTDLLMPLLNAIAEVRARGGAAMWLTRNDSVWSDPSFPATHRLRLTEYGMADLGQPHAGERETA